MLHDFFSISEGASGRLERKLGRELTLIFCLLHALEKIFQKYFLHLEGLPTKSPSYDGPIGQLLKDGLDLQAIVDFQPPPILDGLLEWAKSLPEDFIKSMNNDTQYLYQLFIAIMEGPEAFSKALADRIPGHVHQVKYFLCRFRVS